MKGPGERMSEPTGRGGRTPKLTQERLEQIALALLQGNFRNVAAKAAGITPRTLRRWMKLGAQYPDGIYGALRHRVLEAESGAERMATRAILLAGHTEDVKHLEWWLERKYPERWGKYRGELRQLQKEVEELRKLVADLGQERRVALQPADDVVDTNREKP
jgi:hypothetical protein